jgi:MinD superfamily P-loop ATPase
LEWLSKEKNIPVLMRISFDKEIAFLYSQGIPVVKEKKEYIGKFQDMFNLVINEKQGVFK